MATNNKADSPQGGEEAVAATPAPSAKSGKGKVIKVMHPIDRFVIEDLPVITADGTELTAEQVKIAAVKAKENGVKLLDADGNRVDVEDKK